MSDKKIIVATDLSESSAFAAKWAQDYAALSGAQVVVAHVIEINLSNWAKDAYEVLDDAAEMERVKGQVSGWYQQHTGHAPAHVEVVVGDFEPRLTEIAHHHNAQLLALAKSGKSAVKRFFVGSRAQMMAVHPPCMVALIDAEHASCNVNTQVAVAVDLTEKTSHAIAAGHELLSLTGGDTLHVAHATDLDDSALIGQVLQTHGTRAELIARAEQELTRQASSRLAPNVTVNAHLYDASPAEGLGELVEAHQVDVVVLGVAKAYSSVTNALGRMSVKLAQRLPCTVLIVPPRA